MNEFELNANERLLLRVYEHAALHGVLLRLLETAKGLVIEVENKNVPNSIGENGLPGALTRMVDAANREKRKENEMTLSLSPTEGTPHVVHVTGVRWDYVAKYILEKPSPVRLFPMRKSKKNTQSTE